MKKLALVAFLLGMFGLCAAAVAADKDDPTGTWKIKTKAGKKDIEQTYKFENKDGKVTGVAIGGKDGKEETKIEDGKFKDGEVSFSTKGGKGGTSVTKYNGKLSGDTIKGSVVRDVDGKEQKTDWEAKREAKKD